jgi:peptidoglycan/xylan/chitin deacetylase (PgdA/CDA1 family)
MRREIAVLQSDVLQICGKEPQFFRPPAGFHSPLLIPLLGVMGLRLATWTRRGFDTKDRSSKRVLNRLMRNLAAGDVLLLHDGNAAADRDGAPVVLQVLPRLLEEFGRRGLKAVTLPQATVLPDAVVGDKAR